MDKYQLTRTIRFKLEPVKNALASEINALKSNMDSDDVAEFHTLASRLSSLIEEYLYIKLDEKEETGNTDQSSILNNQLEVKTNWLKQHTKEYYYNWESSQKQSRSHRVTGVFYLRNVFAAWLKSWNKLNRQLKELLERPEENQARRREFAILITEYTKKENFRFIRDFIQASQDKSSDQKKNELALLATRLEQSLTNCEQLYLPDQDKGLVIARASLNYYTINKKPRDYPAEIADKESELTQEIECTHQAITHLINRTGFENQIREFVVNRIFKETDDTVTLDSLYQKMKLFKAEEKKRFEEAIDKGLNFSDIKNNHPLFECSEKDFNLFLERTDQIKSLGDKMAKLDKASADYKKKRSELKKDIAQIKQKRGKDFFFVGSGMKKGAKPYKQFCELYKLVAMKRGRILAEIKGIERERIDSNLLNYWALIFEKDKQHQLVLIPKEKAGQAYRKLEQELDATDHSISVHYIKSLTMRSLKKLCFGTLGNTFAKEIKIELEKSHQSKYNRLQGAFSFEKFKLEKDIVQFYQDVLKTNFVQNNLDIHDFEELKALMDNSSISSLEQFETELEKICYRKRILAGNELVDFLIDDCGAQLMAITSYDLRKHKSRRGDDKQHTKIWKTFWSDENRENNYPVRLNPELKVIWRKAKESRVRKYGKDSKNYNPDKNNRYLHPQFTLATTITENAQGKRLDLSFTDQDTLVEKIQEFNQDYNKQYATNPHEMRFYGIDRGNAELATLALVTRFTDKKNEFGQPIPEFTEFDVYRLKEEYLDYEEEYLCKGEPKQRKAINNLSYFIENEELFESTKTSSIDLTTAKLIKGKIIENGDVLTYLRLKELSAKRRIYEYFSQSNIDRSKHNAIYFEDNEFCIHTLDNNNHAVIYYYRPDLAKIKSHDSIERILNDYLKQLNSKNTERDILTIEKINHLRDAMASNMVGILSYLYNKFPGNIILENLSKDELAGHFLASNENISRRLEWRLYNKFQKLGLVPPRLKETILLRQNQEINQFGVINYIKTENTSKNCPYCGKKNNKKKSDWERDKHNLRLFDCTNSECGFNTQTNHKGMESLSNPDMVASYNIAKRGYEYILNPPKPKKTIPKKTYSPKGKKQQGRKQAKNPPRTRKKPNKAATHNPFANLKDMMKKDN